VIVLFVLVLTRIFGLFLGAPIFMSRGIPLRYRMMLAALISPLLMPGAMPEHLPEDGFAVTVAMVGEMAVGLAIGLLARIVFVSFQIAGTMMGYQMGLAMANVIDPDTHRQTGILGTLLLNLVGLIFLLLDGHHMLVRSLAASFEAFPVGAVLQIDRLAQAVFSSGGTMWEAGARIAGPVTGIMLLINSLLGLINRVMPQMSIFNIGFPLSALTGYLAVLLTIPEAASFFVSAYGRLEDTIARLIAG
jgi:flagellar biosynthetic protein FliR